MDSLQSRLDRMTVTRNEPLVLNGSDSITRANINNNNLSDLRWVASVSKIFELVSLNTTLFVQQTWSDDGSRPICNDKEVEL